MNGTPGSGFVEANGASLYYDTRGEGERLVLLHAGIADRRMWDGQFQAFAERYHAVRYDRRGFGRSPVTDEPYSHHEDLRGLLDSLGIGRANLVGCSMGGGAAIDFALRHPERVRALVLVGSAVSGVESDEPPPKEWEDLVAAGEAGDLGRVSELEVRIWVDGPYRSPEEVAPAVRDLVREMNLLALIRAWRGTPRGPARRREARRDTGPHPRRRRRAGPARDRCALRVAGAKRPARAEGGHGRDGPRPEHGEARGVQPDGAGVPGGGGW